jgi:solute carrier family 35 (UDP-galactose transporter), member B1
MQHTMKKRGAIAPWHLNESSQLISSSSSDGGHEDEEESSANSERQLPTEDSGMNSFLIPYRRTISASALSVPSPDNYSPLPKSSPNDPKDDGNKQLLHLETSSDHPLLPLFCCCPAADASSTNPSSPEKDPTRLLSVGTSGSHKVWQLLFGAAGIYSAYLYYGVVQEDLFRYRSAVGGVGFSFVWALQVLESAVTIVIGYFGRKFCGGRDNLPLMPFFKSGASQLAAKALMSLSLAAGLSFPVVVLAKSAKIVPVMIGQLLMGGSSYTVRDYTFAVLIVAGTSLLSIGNTSEHVVSGSDTLMGLVLITLSLTADGFTGGLQKKLKRVTVSMAPTTYDFLYFSHIAQFCVAIVICFVTGEVRTAPVYVMNNPTIWWWIGASCLCSAVGQCFIFYVISCFDPVVCTTITTTRKMISVMFSISFKGHHLSSWGYAGLGLAVTALLLEVEGKYAMNRVRQHGTVEAKQVPSSIPLSSTTSLLSNTIHSQSQPSTIVVAVPPRSGSFPG